MNQVYFPQKHITALTSPLVTKVHGHLISLRQLSGHYLRLKIKSINQDLQLVTEKGGFLFASTPALVKWPWSLIVSRCSTCSSQLTRNCAFLLPEDTLWKLELTSKRINSQLGEVYVLLIIKMEICRIFLDVQLRNQLFLFS